MNNVINISRLGNYCLKQINEWKRGLFPHFLSIAGVYTVLLFVFRFEAKAIGSQPYISSTTAQLIIWISFFVYMAKVSSSLSGLIGTRSKQVLYLILPVSAAEKYLAYLLTVLLLYPLIFFAGIAVAQYGSEFIASLVWRQPYCPGLPLEGCFAWNNVFFYLSCTLHIITIFMLGATYWKQNAFVKTISVCILVNIIQMFLWIVFLTGEDIIIFAVNMYIRNMEDGGRFMSLLTAFSYIPIVVFGFIGYMRLREMEVNETKL